MTSFTHFFASQQVSGTVYIPYNEISIILEDQGLFGNIQEDTIKAELPLEELNGNITINELKCEIAIYSEAQIV